MTRTNYILAWVAIAIASMALVISVYDFAQIQAILPQ